MSVQGSFRNPGRSNGSGPKHEPRGLVRVRGAPHLKAGLERRGVAREPVLSSVKACSALGCPYVCAYTGGGSLNAGWPARSFGVQPPKRNNCSPCAMLHPYYLPSSWVPFRPRLPMLNPIGRAKACNRATCVPWVKFSMESGANGQAIWRTCRARIRDRRANRTTV